jgi:ribose transport system permease protein
MSVSPQALRPGNWHDWLSRRRIGIADLPLAMPYIYVAVMVGAILVLEPGLIDGPGAMGANFSLVVPLALVAFGQTFAMLTRGIDLSVGGVISVSSALLATQLNATGWLLLPELLAIVALGVAIGCLNGLMIAFTPIQPFIITLATWSIWDGVAFGILPIEGGTVSPTLIKAVSGGYLGVPKSVWIVVLLLLLWRWLRSTRFIEDLVAIGSDESRARLLGVRIGTRKIQCYAASGLLAALASIWVTGQTQAGSPDGGDQFILSSIAAVVIGGTSIFGGKGSAASSIMGAITFLLIPILVFALNLTSFWSIFLEGLVLIVAVTFNSIIQTRARR